MNKWRLIESPASSLSSQMTLDRKLFEEFLQDPESLPVLRLYEVSEPGLSVGRSCGERKGVCVRPTGGGLVRHGTDLIYSVLARRGTFPTFHQVRTSYLSFHEVIQEALRNLGIEARLFRCDETKQLAGRFGQRGRGSECFQNPVATDLLFEEKKIAGGAQWRRGAAFLHQGSVLIPRRISCEELKSAFIGAFQRKFEIVWQAPSGMHGLTAEDIPGRPVYLEPSLDGRTLSAL